jgi:hypothetical protein
LHDDSVPRVISFNGDDIKQCNFRVENYTGYGPYYGKIFHIIDDKLVDIGSTYLEPIIEEVDY